MKVKKLMEGVFDIENTLATVNLVAGKRVYGEELIIVDDKEYRFWNPHRSKVAAAIKKGLKNLHIGDRSQILYLGAAEGTTISHLSDIIGENGVIFGVDLSARSMRKFVYLCEQRPNMVPVLADASQPMSYKDDMVGFKIDTLFQDVSQKNQAEIFLKNSRAYLKIDGYGFLSVKARSIDSSKRVDKIVEEEAKKISREFEILDVISLYPFEKEHAMIYCKKK